MKRTSNPSSTSTTQLSGVYERGFEAGEHNSREGSMTDNPYALDTLMASHETWGRGLRGRGGGRFAH